MAYVNKIDTAKPDGGDDPREADDNMRRIQAGFQEIIDVEHNADLTGTEITGDGTHTDINADSLTIRAGGTITNVTAIGPWFDVVAYGADNTGVASADAEIQLAIDACNTAGGGVVFFPPGNYLLTDALVGYSNVNLIGAGINVTFLEADAALIDYMIKYEGVAGASLNYFRVSDMTLDGNSEAAPLGGIYINWTRHILFERLYTKMFFNAAATGIYTRNSFHVDHIKCVGNLGGGVAPQGDACFKLYDTNGLAGENISQISYYGCQAINSDYGILIPTCHANDGIIIENCGFGYHDTACIRFAKGNSGLRIVSNHFEFVEAAGEYAIYGDGVTPQGSKGIDILNNTFGDCKTAIYLRNLGRVKIDGNILRGNINVGQTITDLGAESIIRLNYGENWISGTYYNTYTGDDPRITAFIANDATPSVGIGGRNKIHWFETNCAIPTNITDFDSGEKGQIIGITGKDGGLSTIVHNAARINLAGGANFTLENQDILILQYDNIDWNEISRSSNH